MCWDTGVFLGVVFALSASVQLLIAGLLGVVFARVIAKWSVLVHPAQTSPEDPETYNSLNISFAACLLDKSVNRVLNVIPDRVKDLSLVNEPSRQVCIYIESPVNSEPLVDDRLNAGRVDLRQYQRQVR